MENLDFIRGLLEGIGDTTIDLSEYATEGDYIVYLDAEHHVCRYWSCSVNETIDIDECDDDDDIPFIMYALQTELIKIFNKRKNATIIT